MDASPAAAPRRPWRRRALALLAGVLLALLAAELVARALLGAPLPERRPTIEVIAHPTRGVQMIPGDRHYTYLHPVRINALGLRGPELGPAASAELRVLVLGDSMVFGHGVAEEDTLPARLERALNRGKQAAGRRYVVVNGGVQAYATNQEIALLEEHGERIAPDVVVLAWHHNDVHERDLTELAAYAAPDAETARARREEGGLARDLAWGARQLLRRSALLMGLNDLRRRRDWPDEEAVERAMERLDAYVRRFLGLADTLGFQPVAAIVPDAPSLTEPNPSIAVDERAVEVFRRHGLPVLEARMELAELCEARGGPPVLPHDGHFDGEANAVLGETFARSLKALLATR